MRLAPLIFQYILCYGSTYPVKIFVFTSSYFNTSYVTVQHTMEGYKIGLDKNFNTSYVTVQLIQQKIKIIHTYHFNTSYVTVQHQQSLRQMLYPTIFQYILCYGSTYATRFRSKRQNRISIHPMLRFNNCCNHHIQCD